MRARAQVVESITLSCGCSWAGTCPMASSLSTTWSCVVDVGDKGTLRTCGYGGT